jgi:biopolymer transport protein ExbD
MNIRSSGRQKVTLDLTPLIDVVFLLLIFFMVSTTFDKQTQLKVALPEASEQAAENQEKDQIDITIDAQGHFYINDEELVTHDVDTLMRAMTKVAVDRTDMVVLVSSDKQAPFQAAIMVMDAVGQLGLSRLSFVAHQTDE